MASELTSRIRADLNQARKLRDKERTLVLSTILADVRNREIESGGELEDADVVQVLAKAIKQRRDAAEQMRAGGREDLARREDAQADTLQAYLPAGLSEDEVRAMVREIVAGGAAQMGAVMGQLMPRIRGRFDGKEANRIVREELEGL
ncbi:MAG: GatB/YqeY domain-containing protein [Gemmatimonadetes bacterium]|nr:GatB/YqeY domain-containing protein [Gemmatimonadota bacterium]